MDVPLVEARRPGLAEVGAKNVEQRDRRDAPAREEARDEPVRLVDVPPVLAQRGVREQRPLPASVRDLLLGVDDHHGEAAAARLDVLADPEEQATRDAPGDAPALRVIGEVDLGRQGAPREGGGRWGRLRAPRHARDAECRQEPVERRVAREPALQANERAPHRGLLG